MPNPERAAAVRPLLLASIINLIGDGVFSMRRHDKQVVTGLITFLLISFAIGLHAWLWPAALLWSFLFGLADLNRR
jgi:hypothetical protein